MLFIVCIIVNNFADFFQESRLKKSLLSVCTSDV